MAPALRSFLSGIAAVALLPELPSPRESVVEVGFPQVVDAALNGAFFLTVADIDKSRPAFSEEPELPLGEVVSSLEPGRVQHHFPAAVKASTVFPCLSDGCVEGRLKLWSGSLIGIEKKNPPVPDWAVVDGPVALNSKTLELI